MSMRIRGKIYKLLESYGFVMGEDGVSRFFMPSGISADCLLPWDDLRVGQEVTFEHLDHIKGARAVEMVVDAASGPSLIELPDGEE